MTALENFVSPALMRALGWTLLHSLWQGALVAAVLAGALLLLRRQRAEVRYVASAGALGVVVALAGITFGLYFGAGTPATPALTPSALKTVRTVPLKQAEKPVLAPGSATARTVVVVLPAAAAERPAQARAGLWPAVAQSAASGWLATGLRYFDNHLPLLVVAWLLGLLAMSLRMLGGLLYVQRLRTYRVRSLGTAWQERLAVLAARSGVRRPVALLESALVQVPLVVGHVRPVILLPLGAVAGLSPACLEAILAHELAHVLRRDYLVNLLQTVAEVLFFYHPAVWFMANCVRTERENCCDDTATALCGGDPLRLARALAALAEWSQSAVVPASPRLALAAIGTQGALLSRIRRLVQRRPAAPTLAEGFMAGALVLGGLGLLGSSVALAGPLSRPAASAGKVTAKVQAAPAQQGPKPAAAGNAKNAATPAPPPPAAPAPPPAPEPTPAPAPPADATRAAQAPDEGDTIYVSRSRRGRNRVSINDRRAVAPRPYQGNPGTVVITKDKKGRLTDLVVNGQRVETGSGKTKTKSKSKSKGDRDDDSRVEIIQVAPSLAPQGQTFVYRGNNSFRYERTMPRVYTLPAPADNHIIYRELVPAQGFNELRRLNQLNQLSHANGLYRLQTPGALASGSSLAETRNALRAAERGLREASNVKNLSAEQRKRLKSRLDDVQAQLKRLDAAPRTYRIDRSDDDRVEVLQLNSDAMRERQEELRHRQEEVRERIEESRQRQEEFRERIRESKQDQADMQVRIRESRRNAGNEEALVNELLKDGLIKDRGNFQLRLTATEMVVDGKDQPKKVHDKYVKLYEKNSGRKMTATSSIMIGRNGDSNEGQFSVRAPRPPRPPREPSATLAPPAPPALAAPAPPRPPRPAGIGSDELRAELRKDGLIGENDKSFQLQLNPSGMTINGKTQSAETAAKYRKLLGHENGTYNMTVTND